MRRRHTTQLTTKCTNKQQRGGGEGATRSKMVKKRGRKGRRREGERKNNKVGVGFGLV